MSTEEPSTSEPGGPRRLRILLSAFFLLHWGSVASYILPATKTALDPVPDIVRPAATLVLPRYVLATAPVAYPYLSITATRQHWTLFAPFPAGHKSTVGVVPYFPDGDGGSWVADTLLIRGPVQVPYPHVLHHRTWRILYNLGYEDFGRWYRPYFAAEMCRTLRSADGRAPEGVGIVGFWGPPEVPWLTTDEEPYTQWMGGFDCTDEERVAEASPWGAYGLPDQVDVTGWSTVQAREISDSTTVGPAPAPVDGGGDR